MKPFLSPQVSLPLLTCTAVLCATLYACSSPAVRPDGSGDLRSHLAAVQTNPELAGRAPLAMQDAEKAVIAAEQPTIDRDHGTHLVFMAQRKIEIAEIEARKSYLIDQRPALVAARTSLQLGERNREVDAARQSATVARADASQQRMQAANSDAQASDARADAGRQRQAAEQARGELALADTDTASAEDAARQLQQQLDDLNARVTDRGTVVTLGDLLFAFGTADLNSGGAQHLARLAAFLTRYPDRAASILGYTDSVGSSDFNLGLSQRRAQAVKDYLVTQGIEGGRLTAAGKGETAPIGDNGTSTGRQQNRRVEVIIANSVISSR